MKICYKLVKTMDYQPTLYISSNGYNGCYYRLNQWTIAPKNTRLFVFDSLDELRVSYGKIMHGFKIFKCQVKGGIKGYPCENIWARDEYWNLINATLKKKKSLKHFFNNPVKGIPLLTFYPSYLVKAVKLIEEVKL
jgi:hypothetical protein